MQICGNAPAELTPSPIHNNNQLTVSSAMLLQQFAADENGATSIEYALIGSMICIVIVAAVTQAGISVSNVFTQVAAGFAN